MVYPHFCVQFASQRILNRHQLPSLLCSFYPAWFLIAFSHPLQQKLHIIHPIFLIPLFCSNLTAKLFIWLKMLKMRKNYCIFLYKQAITKFSLLPHRIRFQWAIFGLWTLASIFHPAPKSRKRGDSVLHAGN